MLPKMMMINLKSDITLAKSLRLHYAQQNESNP